MCACKCGGDGCGLDVFMATEDLVAWQADPSPQADIMPIKPDNN